MIVGVLVLLSLILMATTLFPHIDVTTLTETLFAALAIGLAIAVAYLARDRRRVPVALDLPARSQPPAGT